MNSENRHLQVLILLYFIVWNGQYYLSYLPNLVDFLVLIFLGMVAIVLLVVGLFQFAELILKKPRKGYRILNVVIIGLILILSYYRPYGIIDFNRIEGEDILFVMREGVANCTTSIRLKKDNRFKKTTICFGVDHYWGTYQLVNDTVKLEYNQIPEDSEGAEFLMIHKDTTESKSDQVFYHYGKRIKDGIGMGIVELRKELLY